MSIIAIANNFDVNEALLKEGGVPLLGSILVAGNTNLLFALLVSTLHKLVIDEAGPLGKNQ